MAVRFSRPHHAAIQPGFYTLSSTNLASARAGMNFGAGRGLYSSTIHDTHTVTNYNFSIYPGVAPSLERQYTSDRHHRTGDTYRNEQLAI